MLVVLDADGAISSEGFTANFNAVTGSIHDECIPNGQLLTDSEGYLSDGPGLYYDDMNCVWIIKPTATWKSIGIEFLSFELEQGFDFVKIFDGDSLDSRLIAEFS